MLPPLQRTTDQVSTKSVHFGFFKEFWKVFEVLDGVLLLHNLFLVCLVLTQNGDSRGD